MRISAFTTAGAVLVACGGAAPAEAPAAEATMAPAAEGAAEVAVSAGGYSEAPMLAELVAAGTLPPVDERLPENPMVMDVAEGIGNYGGTLRRGFKGVSDRWGPTKHVDRLLVWWDKDLIQRPRLVECLRVERRRHHLDLPSAPRNEMVGRCAGDHGGCHLVVGELCHQH